ncbi:hypothetical protein MUP65_01595 [Patescibacteria group bacterium]|nr:hypothetical protein [Patescibacteria group bacterium]
MKLVGILIATILLSLLMVWWLNLTIDTTTTSTTTTLQLEEDQNIQSQTGTGSLDYSKQKAEEVNELNQDRNDEIDNLFQQ